MDTACKLFSYGKSAQKVQLHISAGSIVQMVEVSVVRSGEITEHLQACDEITYVVSGKARVYSGEECFEMSAGQIHYIKEGMKHKIVADDNHNFHYYCIGFRLNQEYEDVKSFTNIVKDTKHLIAKDDGRIKSLFASMLNEYFTFDAESPRMINYYFCQMLITLYRIICGNSQDNSLKLNATSNSHVVYHILKYIDRHYLTITNVKEIAQALSYSEYYLSHIFKEKMDMTIKDYLMQKKIATAVELLQSSNMSVSDIAEQLNFSSLHSFGQAFKRYMNMSASDFRKLQQQK